MNTLNDYHNAQLAGFRRLYFIFFVMLNLMSIAGVSMAEAKVMKIVAFGDSLTAGLGVDQDEAYPAKLEAVLRAKGFDVRVQNAGVSGETSKGGLARLNWVIGGDVDLVIVELGANDALRGIDPDETRKNLTAIILNLLKQKKKVVLAGMLAPPNLGEEYGRRFAAIFEDLGKLEGVVFYRFFLDGVAGDPKLNQTDGLHPVPAGYDIIVEKLAPVIINLLQPDPAS